jgi:hypothetical protein
VAADGFPLSVSEAEFPLMATMATGAWLAPGNRVEVMLNGDGTYRNQVLETGGVMVGDRIEITIDIEAVRQPATKAA